MTTAAPTTPKTVRPTVAPLPFWLRRKTRPAPLVRPTPREPRWWIAVALLLVSVLLLGFVGHVALFGVLQHARTQAVGYDELRTSLAAATTPTGQLDFNEKPVPAGTPIALLTIARLGLTEVVRQGTDSSVTRLGVGHRRDTRMPGQVGTSVLFGRQASYGGPFGGLVSLVPGDTITVTTGQGTFDFTVFGIRRPGDPLPQPAASDEGRLQLVTADGPPLAASSVVYIDATLDGGTVDAPAAVLAQEALDPSEQIMGSDSSALLPFLFTLQWLAIASVLARWLLARWGRWQTWIVASPVLLALGTATADNAIALLPNLI
jgi:sortase A